MDDGGKGTKSPVTKQDPSLNCRKFRIVPLTYPDGATHAKVVEVLLASSNFHMWFNSNDGENQGKSESKVGGVSLTFNSEKEARRMYNMIKNVSIGGQKLKIQAPKALMADDVEDDVNSKDQENPEHASKLFISNLLPSSDYDLVVAIFGRENLKEVSVFDDDARSDGSKVAILTFHSAQLAKSAREEYDKFCIDDGEVSRPMRIIAYADYLKRLQQGGSTNLQAKATTLVDDSDDFYAPSAEEELYLKRSQSPDAFDSILNSSSGGSEAGKAGNLWSAQIAPRKEPITLQQCIERMMNRSQVRWSDLHTCADLWMVLDQVCAELPREFGEVDEKDLKKAMAAALDDAQEKVTTDWQAHHIGQLKIKWQNEVRVTNPQSRAAAKSKPTAPAKNATASPVKPKVKEMQEAVQTVEVAQSASGGGAYMPVPEAKKKRSRRPRKDVIGLMGVGALLAGMGSGGSGTNGKNPAQQTSESDSELDSSSEEEQPPLKKKTPMKPKKPEVTPAPEVMKPKSAPMAVAPPPSASLTASPVAAAPSNPQQQMMMMMANMMPMMQNMMNPQNVPNPSQMTQMLMMMRQLMTMMPAAAPAGGMQAQMMTEMQRLMQQMQSNAPVKNVLPMPQPQQAPPLAASAAPTVNPMAFMQQMLSQQSQFTPPPTQGANVQGAPPVATSTPLQSAVPNPAALMAQMMQQAQLAASQQQQQPPAMQQQTVLPMPIVASAPQSAQMPPVVAPTGAAYPYSQGAAMTAQMSVPPPQQLQQQPPQQQQQQQSPGGLAASVLAQSRVFATAGGGMYATPVLPGNMKP